MKTVSRMIFRYLLAAFGIAFLVLTVNGALLIGVSRVAAAEFTFFLAVPVMFGLSLFKLLQFGFAFTSAELVTLIVGSLVAFLVSLVVIKFLMGYIKKHDFQIFGWYRIIVGGTILVMLLLGYNLEIG